MRVCKGCGKQKELKCFPSVRRAGKVYYRRKCKKCDSLRAKHYRATSKTYKVHTKKWVEKRKRQRAAGENSASFLLWDSRKTDKKKGRGNDLTKEFVEDLLSYPCIYCGETALRMTLDRIDNVLGHLQNNVVPACIRCNYARRDMPYEAWVCLLPGIREARQSGAFGTWTGQARRSGETVNAQR